MTSRHDESADYAAQVVGRFRTRMRALRRHLGMTQAEVAAAADTSFHVISKMETGDRSVDVDIAVRICEALGTELGRMLDDAPLTVTVELAK